MKISTKRLKEFLLPRGSKANLDPRLRSTVRERREARRKYAGKEVKGEEMEDSVLWVLWQ